MGLRRYLGFLASVVALIALFLLPRVVSAEEPLSISIASSRESCTRGTLTEVSWRVSGGAGPYEIAVNGSTVDGSLPSERVLCALAEGIADPTHLYALKRYVIRATVTDATGERTSDLLVLPLEHPLGPPRRPYARVVQAWADYRIATLRAGMDRRGGTARDALPPPALYLFRWRHVDGETWTYRSHYAQSSDVYFSQPLQDNALSTPYEVQISELRDPLEQHSPEALRWTRTMTTISEGPPNDLTVQTSSDSAIVTWRSNHRSTEWRLWLAESSDANRWPGSDQGLRLTGQYEHSFEFANLLPDTAYSIWLGQDQMITLPEVTFDFRTEPERFDASRAFPGPRITSVAPTPDGSGLVVEWDAPAIKSEHSFSVYAHEFATPADWRSIQEVATDKRTATITPVRPDTLYRVVVSNRDVHKSGDEVLVRTPPEIVLHGVNQSLGPPAVAVDWYTSNEHFNKPNVFVVDWAPDHGHRFGQIQWQTFGRTMNTFGYAPVPIEVSQPGHFRFRARLRVGERWTRWSPWRDAFTTPSPPPLHGIAVSERRDHLHVEWVSPRSSLTPVDGYRVYVRRSGGFEQIFDVGLETQLRLPAVAAGEQYEIAVAAYTRQYGPGRHSGAVNYTFRTPLRLAADSAVCVPDLGLPAPISWRIHWGAAPFTVSIGDRPVFETEERAGTELIPCEFAADSDMYQPHEATISVRDAHGQWDQVTVLAKPTPLLDEHETDLPSMESFRVFSVSEREAHLGWRCYEWGRYFAWQQMPPLTFLIRVRSGQGREWTLRQFDLHPSGSKTGHECRWTWDGLTPGTTYAFQIAYLGLPSDMPEDDLDWTPARTFTTLTEPRNVQVARDGNAAEVTWDAQPNGWLYLVILRGDNHTWWRLYRPQGEPTERVVFEDIPAQTDLSVDIQLPPVIGGQELIGPGYEVLLPG